MPPAASNWQAVFFSQAMRIQVVPFGVLKNGLGAKPAMAELPQGAAAAKLCEMGMALEGSKDA